VVAVVQAVFFKQPSTLQPRLTKSRLVLAVQHELTQTVVQATTVWQHQSVLCLLSLVVEAVMETA
jgi:hypothetical protein